MAKEKNASKVGKKCSGCGRTVFGPRCFQCEPNTKRLDGGGTVDDPPKIPLGGVPAPPLEYRKGRKGR